MAYTDMYLYRTFERIVYIPRSVVRGVKFEPSYSNQIRFKK
jgi:hypothetical protein